VLAPTNKYLAQSNKPRTRGPASNKATGSAAHSSGAANRRGPRCGVSALLVFTALSRREFERKLKMSWHHPDLYLFLCLLAGFATFLAIVYECVRHRRKPPIALPLDGLQRDRPARTEERANRQPSDFSQLCENVEDLSPKKQASRVDEHFGIFGGARPADGRDRKGKRQR
jgi:hypothetical protein